MLRWCVWFLANVVLWIMAENLHFDISTWSSGNLDFPLGYLVLLQFNSCTTFCVLTLLYFLAGSSLWSSLCYNGLFLITFSLIAVRLHSSLMPGCLTPPDTLHHFPQTALDYSGIDFSLYLALSWRLSSKLAVGVHLIWLEDSQVFHLTNSDLHAILLLSSI